MRKQTILPFKRIKSEFEMEHNDCTVLAISAATPLTYREAHKLLATAGRQFGRGFRLRAWLNFEPEPIPGIKLTLAYNWINAPMMERKEQYSGVTYARSRNLTVGQFVLSRPEGNYLVFVRRHVFAVIDGVIRDAQRQGSRRIVQKIYKVEV